MKHMLRCTVCKNYTFNQVCKCGAAALDPKPPKFSPEDKYARYRREVKQEGRKEQGLI